MLSTQRAHWESPELFTPYLTRLTLTDFRSYHHMTLSCDSGSVVLTGDNGSGKTNILEAISLLSPSRGLRSANISDMKKYDGAGSWTISTQMHSCEGDIQIGVGVDVGTESRRLRINGREAKGFEQLTRLIPQLWLTPSMDRLFVEGAMGRRKFLDRFALYLAPSHNKSMGDYEKSMRARNRLLQEGELKNSAWLDSLEQIMACEGVAIADIRLCALDMLSACLLQDGHSDFPQAGICLEGHLESALRHKKAVEVEDDFRRYLRQSRRIDAEAGRTLEGPHRSDLIVHHVEKNIGASSCSTGEQKALLIGLLLAQARVLSCETGSVPILLLDEVVAHLDARRRVALFKSLSKLGTQAWITATDAHMFTEFSTHVIHLQIIDKKIVSLKEW